jgi:hypothetical protein
VGPGNLPWTNLSDVMSTASTIAVESKPRRFRDYPKPRAGKHSVNAARAKNTNFRKRGRRAEYVEKLADKAATGQIVKHVRTKHGNKKQADRNGGGDNPKGPKQPRTHDGAGGSGGSYAATQPNVYTSG